MRIKHVQEVVKGQGKQVQVVLEQPAEDRSEAEAFAAGLLEVAKAKLKALGLDLAGMGVFIAVDPQYLYEGSSQVQLVCQPKPGAGSSALDFVDIGLQQLLGAAMESWANQGPT